MSERKWDWDDLFMGTAYVGFVAVIFCVVLAPAIWAVSSAVSYAGCEISPRSERCIAIEARDRETLAEEISEQFQ